jgi:hypothetical protein
VNLFAIRQAAIVFSPRCFLRKAEQIGPGDMVMMTNLATAQAAEIAFRPIRAGTVKTVGCQIASKRDPLFASNNDPLCM